ncbi:glutaredoxin family protein [Candidatus Micrarchaeota archaeon]|nr:glutaredoxin family protein [Candidatus Micrarchaeota archaeon]
MTDHEKKITVYSAPWCPWCKRVVQFLTQNNIKYEVKDIEEKEEYAKEVIEKSGQTGIPVTDIDGTIIVGFDVPALKKALSLV